MSEEVKDNSSRAQLVQENTNATHKPDDDTQPPDTKPRAPKAEPDSLPPMARTWDEAFQEAHALYMKQDFEGALASAEKDLLDPKMPRSTRIQLLLIAAQCGTDREQRYRQVNFVAESFCCVMSALC
jgi:hypothetical protein